MRQEEQENISKWMQTNIPFSGSQGPRFGNSPPPDISLGAPQLPHVWYLKENIPRLIWLEAISLNRNFIKFKQLFSWAPKAPLPSSQKTLSRCTEDALSWSTHTATSHWESICSTEWEAWRNFASHGQGAGFGGVQPPLSPQVYYSFKSAPSVHSRLQVSDSRRRPVLVLCSLLGISFNNGKGTCVMPLLFSHTGLKSSTG